MSDPKHFDHILPFLQPADGHHAIPIMMTDDDVRIHAVDDASAPAAGEPGDLDDAAALAVGELAPSITDCLARAHVQGSGARAQMRADSGEQVQVRTESDAPSLADSWEQAQVRRAESVKATGYLSLKDHKVFRHGRDVQPQA